MRIRVGLLDGVVLAMVVALIAIPDRRVHVHSAYAGASAADVRDVARYQALWEADQRDGELADALSRALLDLGHSDWALRVAGTSAAYEDSPTAWRAHLAVSSAHARRLEIDGALASAKRSLDGCEAAHAACPDHWHARIALYVEQLERGVAAGIDPVEDPEAFRRESMRMFPSSRALPHGELD